MASAYVAGIAALMIEKVPTLTGEQVYQHLEASARRHKEPFVDMCHAINQVAGSQLKSCQATGRMAVMRVGDNRDLEKDGPDS